MTKVILKHNGRSSIRAAAIMFLKKLVFYEQLFAKLLPTFEPDDD